MLPQALALAGVIVFAAGPATAADLTAPPVPVAPLTASAPAVSAPNWELGGKGGARDDDGAFLIEGSYTAPLGYDTGFRLDGAAGVTEEGFQGAAGFHYFRRDPSVGLIGGFVNWATVDPDDTFDNQTHVVHLGAEGERYLGNVSVGGAVGAQLGEDIEEGVFAKAQLEWYAHDDLMFAVEGQWDPERDGIVSFDVEYQPGYLAHPGLAWFLDAAVGNHDYAHIFAGARVYSGGPKPLIERHRADTFRLQTHASEALKVPDGEDPLPPPPPPVVEEEEEEDVEEEQEE
jgi:hypothetical protein